MVLSERGLKGGKRRRLKVVEIGFEREEPGRKRGIGTGTGALAQLSNNSANGLQFSLFIQNISI